MKNALVLNSFAVFIAVMLFANIDDLLSLSWNWGPVLLLLPAAAGAITALIQNEDRSYDYLPKIIINAFLFAFLAIFLVKLINFFRETNVSLPGYFNPFGDKDEILGHFGLIAIYISGGLAGILIRGINQLFLSRYKIKLNLNISFINSLLFGSFILLAANAHYVINSVPPDGRWKLQLPATSFLVACYLALFILASKKLLKNPRHNFIMWAYNAILSLAFLSWARPVQVVFQDTSPLYWRYIPTAPYIIIFGLGIIIYFPLVYFYNKEKIHLEA